MLLPKPLSVVVIGALAAGTALAASDDGSLTGFTPQAAKSERQLERSFAATLDPKDLRKWLAEISASPHVAGSGSDRVANSLAQKFASWGFDTKIETFYALMSTPRERVVEMIEPRPLQAALSEPEIPGYTPKDSRGSLPPYNVYSKDGDVTAQAVYVNYGLPEDYEVLARERVDVKGKIVVARYGRAYRGIKPRLAAANGAVGILLFSEPADDGYGRGVPYPKGPFLPVEGYQRGSVLDITRFSGDPLTPGSGATSKPASFRLADVAQSISPIPVQPLSAKDVEPILGAMEGPVAPPDWHGALPITYRLGGNVKVHLKIQQDWQIVPVYDVVATLTGSRWPDQWVLRGNNHDAWNYGAMVAGSGLVAMMEEARAIGSLAKSGWRPSRTLVYLAWDAEEEGLIGSTEWVETHASELSSKAVAYLNSGITTQGLFAASGSHVLETLINEVAKQVEDPKLKVPLYDRIAANVRLHGDDSSRQAFEATGRYRIDALGLGSDWTPFLHHLGIPSLEYAFEGAVRSGVYHSIYDDFDFYDRFGDPGYQYGAKLAEAYGRTVLRLADADVIPFDFSGTAFATQKYINEVSQLADTLRTAAERENADIRAHLQRLADDPDGKLATPKAPSSVPAFDFAPLRKASDRLNTSAAAFASAQEAFRYGRHPLNAAALLALNQKLRATEAVLAPEQGLPGRPWYRHLLYAPGAYTGYGVKTLPTVREALEQRDWKTAASEIVHVAQVLERYSDAIDACTADLTGRSPDNE